MNKRESINVKSGKLIVLRKIPTKEQIFKEFVGCITTPIEEKSTESRLRVFGSKINSNYKFKLLELPF